MKNPYINQVIERFERNNLRYTPQRAGVAEQISRNKGLFSAETIKKKTKNVDRASVYRAIKLFAKLDLIHPVVTLKEKEYYEIHGRDHHHHEICTQCEKTNCIPCPLPKQRSKMLKVEHHTFAITGLCKSCA